MRKLFIGNLDYDANENDIREALERFGEIEFIFIPQSNDYDHQGRGFGFISFVNESDAEKLLNSEEPVIIRGRQVQFKESIERRKYKAPFIP